MKHFRVRMEANSHQFEYRCSSMSDAYDAVLDASVTFGIQINLDEVIIALVEMKRENQLSAEWYRLRISVEDGEV